MSCFPMVLAMILHLPIYRYLGFAVVYNGQRQATGSDDTCPQESLSPLGRENEVAVIHNFWN